MKIHFLKMQAFGNDYVYIDAVHQRIENPGRLAAKISDRHFGVGSDGLVLICPSEVCDVRMRIFNPDGTEAEMCGNALRSTGKFAYEQGLCRKEELTVETLGGRQKLWLTVEKGRVTDIHACIGKPEFSVDRIPMDVDRLPLAPPGGAFLGQPLRAADRVFTASALSWGNPHTVLMAEDVERLAVEKYGPLVEHMDCFPRRTNVTFAQVVDSSHIKIREWERGTGETIGCGTGCCSALVAAHLQGMCGRKAQVEQIGGILSVEWDEEGLVHMTGPSHVVYRGEYEDEAE